MFKRRVNALALVAVLAKGGRGIGSRWGKRPPSFWTRSTTDRTLGRVGLVGARSLEERHFVGEMLDELVRQRAAFLVRLGTDVAGRGPHRPRVGRSVHVSRPGPGRCHVWTTCRRPLYARPPFFIRQRDWGAFPTGPPRRRRIVPDRVKRGCNSMCRESSAVTTIGRQWAGPDEETGWRAFKAAAVI